MKKLTVSQAAEYFGITKEAIYNRVRRGKLKTVVEDGLKYVVVNENTATSKHKKSSQKSANTKDKYVSFLEAEVDELKKKVAFLESENRKLIEEKISILEKSKKELEQIFATRDEQLKQILHLMNEKYALPKIESVEVIDTNIKQKSDKKSKKKKKNKKKKR